MEGRKATEAKGETMSGEPDPMRACYGKRRYDTEQTATTVAADLLRRRDVRLRAYICESCGGWHLSSKGVPRSDDEMKPGWRVAEIGRREQARRRHIEQRHTRRRR